MILDIQHIKWDSFIRSLLFKDPITNLATDITWSTITFTIKKNKGDTINILQANATLTTPASWIADINVPGATMSIATGDYYYDMQWISQAGDITTFLNGKFTITYEITIP